MHEKDLICRELIEGCCKIVAFRVEKVQGDLNLAVLIREAGSEI